MKTNKSTYPIQDRWAFLWLALALLFGIVSNGRWIIPLAGWLSPIFMIRFLRTQPVKRGFLLVGLAVFLIGAIGFYGIMFWMPIVQYLITMFFTSFLIGAVPYLIDRLVTPKFNGFATTLVYPLAATALEFLSFTGGPTGTVGATPYTQYSNLALVQIASVTGMWSISFLIGWVASTVNWVWENQFNWSEVRRGVAVVSGAFFLVLAYGGTRLALASAPTETVRMHGITEVDMRQEIPNYLEVLRSDWAAYGAFSAGYQERYIQRTIEEAQAGAEIVHWPEMALWLPVDNEAGLIQSGQEVARQEGIYIVMPYAVHFEDDRPFQNKLVIIAPNGEVVLEHLKYGGAMVEGFDSGDGILREVSTPFGKMTALICADTNFPTQVRQSGKMNADILFSPSLEVASLDPIHAHMAAFRAIENGVTVVRQADNGLSVVIDPYGRILDSVDHFQSGERTMVSQVPAHSHTFTLYPLIGDLFAWSTVIGMVIMSVMAVIRSRREKWAAVNPQINPQNIPVGR